MATSIAQDLAYAEEKKEPNPKTSCVGLAIHQATRSKMLVNLAHNTGHCAMYDQVRRIDTALAQHTLDRYVADGYTVVPSTLMEKKFLQFAADNIYIIEETLGGKGTFHITQIVVFWRGKADQQQDIIDGQRDYS